MSFESLMHPQPWLEQFAEAETDVGMFMNKSGEAVALLASLFIVLLLPEAIHHGMK